MPWAKALAHRNTSAEMDLNPEDQRGEMTCLKSECFSGRA